MLYSLKFCSCFDLTVKMHTKNNDGKIFVINLQTENHKNNKKRIQQFSILTIVINTYTIIQYALHIVRPYVHT